ncbi:hypothetical protein [Nitrososphaera sp.]|uniref:Zn-ribbon domain-containing OB-fold protein n=1 Tax=Nitrososphaera sp. TaxID=1971748 RepID=UPI002ED89633
MESEFANRLKRGVFRVPVCTRCGKKAWPPSSTCASCYSKTALKKVGSTGVLVEFAASHLRGHEGIFGIVEMDGFRLVGSFESTELAEGMQVRMVDCGMRDGTPCYLFAPDK